MASQTAHSPLPRSRRIMRSSSPPSAPAGDRGYGHVADRMVELAAQQPGFLGIETVRGRDGFGITVSYWSSLEAISAWKQETEHQSAQEAGKSLWYSEYQLRISHVQRAYGNTHDD